MHHEMKLVFDNMREMSVARITDVYDQLLKPNFGDEELDTLETVIEGLTKGTTQGLCAMDGANPVGCVLGYPYAEALLIGYVVVDEDARSHRVGSKLFDEVRQRWFRQPGVKLVTGEIEDPHYYPVVGGVDPKRRVAFYGQQGVQIVVGPYFQPRLGEGRKRVYNLFLTALTDSSNAASPPDSVPAKQIAEFLLAYFGEAEGKDWPRDNDEEGKRLLAWYQERDVVELHPIDGYEDIEIPQVTD